MVQLETCLCTILAERQEGDLPPKCLGDIQILSVQLFAIELRYAYYDMLYDLVFFYMFRDSSQWRLYTRI